MKKSFIIVYSVIVSLILIFAISFFGVNIYNENQHGSLRTQLRFDKMTASVNTALDKTSLSTSELNRQIDNAIGDTKDFAYIKITSAGKTVYQFPENYDETRNSSSKLIIKYYKTSGKNSFDAGLYSLRPGSIFSYAKISFFIILIVALLTVIMIIYSNHFDKGRKYVPLKKKPAVKKQFEEDEEFYNEDEEDSYEDESSEVLAAMEKESVPAEDTEPAVNEESLPESEPQVPAQPEPVHKEEPAQLPTQDYEPVELEEVVSEQGLFSPDTGFGWESYLMTRLENELNRATASELDLALFVIKINGIGRANPVMKKICEYLIAEFQFKDLLFEYKDDSVCGIKISMHIDDAISFGEKITEDIKHIAAQENPEVYCGITTRGIRMVTGERLLKEADEAVVHAMEDKSCPVVGFRADAVKYRKFIETK